MTGSGGILIRGRRSAGSCSLRLPEGVRPCLTCSSHDRCISIVSRTTQRHSKIAHHAGPLGAPDKTMAIMNLKDQSLFRQAALVGGDWLEANAENGIAVENPATGEIIGHVPKLGAKENARGNRSCPRRAE